MTIVFLDASALFSAALSATGASRELPHLGFLGKLRLVISPFVVEETRRNLALKAPADLPALEVFLEAAPLTVVDPTLADGVLDRLVHNAYRLQLKGDSRAKPAPRWPCRSLPANLWPSWATRSQ